MPHFSIIIALYNDWKPLDHCLHSLAGQENAPAFEVIVVDDGSEQTAPESIRTWNNCFPLAIVRQSHEGIAAARNRGIQNSTGSVLVFTDADCVMQRDGLAALHRTMIDNPQHNCFQLHLVSERSSLVGRAEELRLLGIQNQTLQPDGCIRYLNTAGFAIRRESAGSVLFNPVTQRAEDTLLLANLIGRGELPFFVPDAIVQHAIQLSLTQCFFKDIRSAWREGKAYDIIAAKGVTVRMNDRARMRMLLSMWSAARQPSIGTMAWCVVLLRRTVHRITRGLYKAFGIFRRPFSESNQQ